MLEEITYYREIRKHKVLSAEEEKKYSTQAKLGIQDALNKMVCCNQRLVVKIALKFTGRGIDVLDLIGEGNLGLMKAINMFEPDRGFRFSTYASWWIKCFIKQAILSNTRTVRLPTHTIKKVTKYLNAVDNLTKKLQRHPTLKEIAKTLRWKIQKVSDIALLSECTLSCDRDSNGGGEGSWRRSSNDEENNLYNYLESTNIASPEDEELITEIKKLLYSGIKTLKKQEQDVLLKRFGMLGDSSKTLAEIGQTFAISHEMIRKHQASAIDKLKNYFDKLKLKIEDLF